MGTNTIGRLLQLTTFGESHSKAIGGIIEGFPAGVEVDFDLIAYAVKSRKTGVNVYDSNRKEDDLVEFLSGIFQGKTLGTPIGFVIYNTDRKSDDYDSLQDVFRPSHADYTTFMKYGIRDHRGGGRASARETLNWVVAGAFAKMLLKPYGVEIKAYISQIGTVKTATNYSMAELNDTLQPPLHCPDPDAANQMNALLTHLRQTGDTTGGRITCVVTNCPLGLGEPVFGKLQASLAHAMMNINAAKGFEYGSGFEGASTTGQQHNDSFISEDGLIKTTTNNSGGIQGGISNGNAIEFSVAFKPVSSVAMEQQTVDMEGNQKKISVKGRHDTCPVPRAIPIVEALTAWVIADNLLLQQNNRVSKP